MAMSDMRVMDQSYLPRVEKEPEPSSLDGMAAPASAFCGRFKSMVDDG